MKYRADIDGLRAWAVLPVLFFHAGFAGFAGGFVGVDVFFVISGYLITRILVDEIHEKRFSPVQFYERRVRRLMPAFFAMVLGATVLSAIILPAPMLMDYGKSLVATLAFASNWFFNDQLDYFSASAEQWGLLHMWSLAIEEQYYFILPLVLLGLSKVSLRLILPTLGLLAVASFGAMLLTSDPQLAFYSTATRAWELLAGSVLALLPAAKTDNRRALLLSATGLALLAICIEGSVLSAHWPSELTVLPVLATALLLRYSHPNNMIGKFLSLRLFVGVGLISYSLYLWHQPLYALARVIQGHPDTNTFVLLTAASFALAYLSYRFVEQPFRNRQRWPRLPLFIAAFSATILFAGTGLAFYKTQGWPERSADVLTVTPRSNDTPCHANVRRAISYADSCVHRPDTHTTDVVRHAVLGDSHGSELAFALPNTIHAPVRHLTYSGCSPAFTYSHDGNPGCSAFVNDAVAQLVNDPDITHVVLANRHHLYFTGSGSFQDWSVNGGKVNKDNQAQVYFDSVEAMITTLKDAGKEVTLLLPVPPLSRDIRHLLPDYLNQAAFGDMPRYAASTRQSYQESHAMILASLKALSRKHGIRLIDPTRGVCDDSYCYYGEDGQAWYFDDDHLSQPGIQRVLDAHPFLHTHIGHPAPQ